MRAMIARWITERKTVVVGRLRRACGFLIFNALRSDVTAPRARGALPSSLFKFPLSRFYLPRTSLTNWCWRFNPVRNNN